MLSRLRSTGLLVGDARRPDGGGWQGAAGSSTFATYLVLYPLSVIRSGPDAPLSDRNADPQLTYQVTSVGVDRRSAETAADLAAARLLNGVALDIPGRATVQLFHESSLGVTRDEDVNPPLFYAVDRFRLDTSV